MAYNYEYPYTDPNRYNSDWMLTKMKEIEGQISAIVSGLPSPSASDSMWANVKAFGAKGDGYTDDTEACQKALDAGFNMVYFPPGTYNTRSLKIASNTTVFAKKGTVTLHPLGDNIMINKSDGVTGGYNANTGIVITGFIFDAMGISETSVAFGHANNVIIYDNDFINNVIWHCIEITGCRYVTIKNNRFLNYNANFNASGSEMIQLDFMYNSVVFPWFGPYDNSFCKNVIIDSNYFEGTYPVNFAGSTDRQVCIGSHSAPSIGYEPHDITIINNQAINVGCFMRPIALVGAVIANNIVDLCGAGILFNNAGRFSQVLIAENYIFGYWTDGIISAITDSLLFRGIGVFNNSNINITEITVIGNVIRHMLGHCLALPGYKNTIANNVLGDQYEGVIGTSKTESLYCGYGVSDTTYIGNECDTLRIQTEAENTSSARIINCHARTLNINNWSDGIDVYNCVFDQRLGNYNINCKIVNSVLGNTYIDKQGY